MHMPRKWRTFTFGPTSLAHPLPQQNQRIHSTYTVLLPGVRHESPFQIPATNTFTLPPPRRLPLSTEPPAIHTSSRWLLWMLTVGWVVVCWISLSTDRPRVSLVASSSSLFTTPTAFRVRFNAPPLVVLVVVLGSSSSSRALSHVVHVLCYLHACKHHHRRRKIHKRKQKRTKENQTPRSGKRNYYLPHSSTSSWLFYETLRQLVNHLTRATEWIEEYVTDCSK